MTDVVQLVTEDVNTFTVVIEDVESTSIRNVSMKGFKITLRC